MATVNASGRAVPGIGATPSTRSCPGARVSILFSVGVSTVCDAGSVNTTFSSIVTLTATERFASASCSGSCPCSPVGSCPGSSADPCSGSSADSCSVSFSGSSGSSSVSSPGSCSGSSGSSFTVSSGTAVPESATVWPTLRYIGSTVSIPLSGSKATPSVYTLPSVCTV